MIENDKLLRHVDSMFKQTSPLEILSPQNIRSLVQQTKTAINGSIANLSQINLSKLNLGGNNEPQWALASGTEINQQDNSDQRNKSLTISHLGIFGWGGEKKEYELGDDGIVREVQKSDPNNTINNSEPSPAENSNDNKDPQEYKDVGFWGRCYQDQNGNEISAQEYDELVKKHSARTSSRDASTANTDSNTVKKDSSRNPDEYKDVGFWGRCYQDKDGNEISVKEYEELVKKHSARTSSRDVSTANTDSGTDNIAQETIQIVNEINGGSFIEPERGLGACAKYSKDVVKALEKKGIQAETLFLPDRSHIVFICHRHHSRKIFHHNVYII
jgi:hypothetical protein